MIKDIDLPQIEKDDIIAVFTIGAYGYSMASNYNKNKIPSVILIKEGKTQEIIKRQSYEDIVKNERMLEI